MAVLLKNKIRTLKTRYFQHASRHKLSNVTKIKRKSYFNHLLWQWDENPRHKGTFYTKYKPISGKLSMFITWNSQKIIFFTAIRYILNAIHMLKSGYRTRKKYSYNFCSYTPHQWGSPLRKTDDILQYKYFQIRIIWAGRWRRGRLRSPHL